MDNLNLLQILLTGGIGVMVFFFKRTLEEYDSRLQHQQEEINHIKEKFLSKDDFKEFKSEIKSLLQEIKTDIKQLAK